MTFLEEFKKRGYFHQCTNEEGLEAQTRSGKITAYIGFDCTAKSLHVGNLMQIMILRLLQKHGHKPIILIGGATTKIGDPTGKDEMRKYLSDEDIQANIEGIKKSLSKYIIFGDGPSDALMLNNSEWLEQLGYIEFLRDMGRNFSINKMLTMDSVRLRLERDQSLSFLEFNYMLLQAYDFYYLNKEYNCTLQLGGSDQWGNIVTGTELIRKMRSTLSGDLPPAFGLTTPLLTTSSGVKMGKSVGGAVWLNEDQLSPYDFYQYWRDIEDEDVSRFAKLYCEFSEDELYEFEATVISNINDAKKKLAHRVTKLCHGGKNAEKAEKITDFLFDKSKAKNGSSGLIIPADLGIDMTELLDFIPMKSVGKGGIIYDIIYEVLNNNEPSGATSKSEIKKLIRGGGVKINNITVKNENLIVDDNFFNDQGLIKISIGRKKHFLAKALP